MHLLAALIFTGTTFNFESTTQGWSATGGASIYRSTARAKNGSASLAVKFASSGGTQAAKVTSNGPAAGAPMTFNVYCPTTVKLNWLQPYANAPFVGAYSAPVTLGSWKSYTVTAPAGSTEAGVQFNVVAGYTGTCYIDYVVWTTNTLETKDTTPPVVAINAASTLSGTATVAADTSGGAVAVQFALDGQTLGGEDAASPYQTSFDSRAFGNGSHALTARARDGAGNVATATKAVYIDNDTNSGGLVEPGSPGVVEVTFTIRSDMDTKAISPLIYGSNTATAVSTANAGMMRLGGNRWTAYNWENNASNAGNDYNFQNDGYLSSSDTPGAALKSKVDTATANGAASLVTVPILDYVAADKNGGGDVRNSGANYLTTRFENNRPFKGSAFSMTPSSGDGYVYADEYVNWVKNTFPSSTILFSLDNEPDLWADTHAEIHPSAPTYAELVRRNIDYARAVKSVIPSAKTTGFVSYGFYGFVNLQDAPDAAGNGEFVDYYLKKMKEAEATYGKRLVDYLDLHWYPEAKGSNGVRIIGADTSSATVAARIQAPRSLWDPTYKENSWVANYLGQSIRLIDREQAKIDANYPGTKLAFTEWNYGGGGHISGAIATADVLGIFGRDGVGMASIWDLNSDESFTYAALRAFRNFDGNGATFGDTSMHADTSDVVGSSVYASYDKANPSRVVVVAINKEGAAQKAGITLANARRFTSAKVYTLTAAGGARLAAAPSISPVATNAFSYIMPAYSVSVIVPQ